LDVFERFAGLRVVRRGFFLGLLAIRARLPFRPGQMAGRLGQGYDRIDHHPASDQAE